MFKQFDVSIIGAGIFGVEIALALSELGMSVVLVDQNPQILQGASGNNQNRVHQGFHYPRDMNTAKQSLTGFRSFTERHGDCLFAEFPNYYAIAEHESRLSASDFLAFCDELGADYQQLDPQKTDLQIRNISLLIQCSEAVYDFSKLRDKLASLVAKSNISTQFNSKVTNVTRGAAGFEVTLAGGGRIRSTACINCSYHELNNIKQMVELDAEKAVYEYTLVPVIKLDFPPFGLTVMDGKFFTVLPFGQTSEALLYHVTDSRLFITDNLEDLDLYKDRLSDSVKRKAFESMVKKSSEFAPWIDDAELKGFLSGPRIILEKNISSDGRPTIVEFDQSGFISVMSGKIDHAAMAVSQVVGHFAQ